MNIFYLHNDPKICAQYHADKHVVKMILETSQLLSTAHRILDGVETVGKTKTGRNAKRWKLPDDREEILYSATHINHPSAVWVRQSQANYVWLQNLLVELCLEYTHRYGRVHKVQSSGLSGALHMIPNNIDKVAVFTEPTPAMPDDVKISGDSIASYRNYYVKNKTHLASWKGKVNSRPIPKWFSEGCLQEMVEFSEEIGEPI
ncbi:MAG: hypothetical protein EBU90_16995 [Proteobacteria bacterium]|nr:hypothetical protein [Pseudomonadota bacterium]